MFPNKTKKNNRNLSIYKARVINELGISVFYEDDEWIVDYLESECQGTKIVLVENPHKM